jgi:indolepyruvate decarboxylase
MPTTVKDYLVSRLDALGGRHLFTVPGNYNAEFLLAAAKRLECIGTTNELEAGYAADAYARLTGRIGVCCITYGVGSFSLLNAFAGSHVEFCPVVLINGSAPRTKAVQLVEQGVLFAHAIDPVRTDERVFRQITDPERMPGDRPLTAVVTDPFDAPAQIDGLLRACVTTRRPVYLEVRQDVWGQPCADPVDPEGVFSPQEDGILGAEQERAARTAARDVLRRVRQARHPVLWGGEMLQRLGLERAFQELIDILGLPYTTTLMAKGLVSETANRNRFIGVYDSKFAPRGVKQVVEGSDCLLGLGTILSDFYGDIVAKSYDRMILAAGHGVRVGNYLYPNVPLDRFVTTLLEELQTPAETERAEGLRPLPPPGFQELVDAREQRLAAPAAAALAAAEERDAAVTWDSFFERMRTWTTPDMVLLVDTSLALFPAAEIPIERPGRFVAQTAWLSIGYTVGAAVGASMAVPDGRPVAFVGDGGFQTIAQAFSTLARHKKPAILFVFDNQLYGIEQYLVDMQVLPPAERFYPNPDTQASFFDILPQWDYVKLAEAFGGRGYPAKTRSELEQVLEAVSREKDLPAIVAVRLDPRDLPAEIRATFETAPAVALAAGGAVRAMAPAGFN